jgi:TolB-like protein/DNA-binding winged helix-turn-helix (wHTH) protein
MANVVKHLYEFGPFLLDPEERLLRRGSERLDLPPRVFDTLLALAESDGRLLEKGELMDRIWPDAVVEENNLTQAIYLLRKVLQDGENGSRYIETAPKRGYRFVAPVRDVNRDVPAMPRAAAVPSASSISSNGAAQPISSALAATHPSRHRLPIVLGTLLVVFCALLLSVPFASHLLHRHAPPSKPLIHSLAVLPLQNLSNDPNQEYFADGMTDELITDLAQIHELKVVSKTSIMQYKGTRKPLPQIGRELGVDAVVEGSVLRSGDRVRITAQLIRTSTDRHLWAQSYEGELKNVLSLQAGVAEAITREVRLSLDEQEKGQLHSARTYDPEIYDLYLRGRYAFQRRNPDGFREAMGYYQQAVTQDPNFSLGYSGLADCYTEMALFGDGYRWVPDAIANARHALILDDSLAEAHASLAAADVLDWQWDDAERQFQQTLKLNPNDAQAHQWYGNLFLGPMGRHQEAIAELQRALDLDPLSLVINADLGYAYFLAGQDDAALSQYQKVLALDSTFLPAHYDLMLYYQTHGMYDQEVQQLVVDQQLSGNPQLAEYIQRLSTNRQAFMAKLVKTGGNFGHVNRSLAGSARASLELGNREQALAFLQKSLAAKEADMIYLKVDPTWYSLHDDPEFQDMERKIGLLSR